jgi:hypothetical protein
MRSSLLAVALACLVPSTALADKRVAIVPPFAEPGVPQPLQQAILAQATAALRERGFEALEPETLVRAYAVSPAPCQDTDCALEAIARSHADLAAQLTMFDENGRQSVSIALVMPPVHVFAAGAALQGDPRATVRALVSKLADDVERGPGPWLDVDATPAHAAVHLDGAIIGLTPLHRRITPGAHLLVVRARDYEDFNTTLEVPSAPNTVIAFPHIELVRPRLLLEQEESTPSPVLPTWIKPSAADWTVSYALMAAGLTTAVLGLRGVSHASCGDDGTGRCLSAATRAELVLGPVLLAAGVTWLLRAPWARRSERLRAVRRALINTPP